MYCSECGTDAGNASFCPDCGEELDQSGSVETDTEESVTAPPTEDGINWGHAGKAGLIGLLPAFGAYMLISLANAGGPVGVAFLIGIGVFGYLLYKQPTTKAMFGGAFYWLAIEMLLSPLVMIIYTFTFASSQTSSDAGAAGAALGGGALTIMAFVVGLPLGIVFYLLSGRLTPE
ncbi:zinc ribbon domain-containing protein [Halorientalis salina]|uniref:zinc ribbon domain-containing protein n=1 Tax=Halorientalis salina TaxID=2932266 RepID=UPI0010ACF223|nr:zinc ribbon domain-containing protein [Halorientalis salina]